MYEPYLGNRESEHYQPLSWNWALERRVPQHSPGALGSGLEGERMATKGEFFQNDRVKLGLISFAALFLELVIIRWLSSEVRIFAYFKNLPLFAAFLGLGAGYIMVSKNRNYFRYTPALLLAAVLVIGLAPRLGYSHVVFANPYEYYLLGAWKSPSGLAVLRGLGLLAGIFALIVFLFVGIGEKVGQFLNATSALSAYSINIGFGLAGVLV